MIIHSTHNNIIMNENCQLVIEQYYTKLSCVSIQSGGNALPSALQPILSI